MRVSTYKQNVVSSARGFTLVELLVAMLIAAILAGIAIPNYNEYIRRGHRSSAQAFISDVAGRQAQFFIDRRTYATTVAALNVAPTPEIAARYNIVIATVVGPPAGFTITATPLGPQAGDRCGALTVDQAGNKGAAETRCW